MSLTADSDPATEGGTILLEVTSFNIKSFWQKWIGFVTDSTIAGAWTGIGAHHQTVWTRGQTT